MKFFTIFSSLFTIVILSCNQSKQSQLPADAKLNLANAYYTNGFSNSYTKRNTINNK